MAWRSFWSPDRVFVLDRLGRNDARLGAAPVSNVVPPATATWPPERDAILSWAWPGDMPTVEIQSLLNAVPGPKVVRNYIKRRASLLGLKRSEAYKVAVMSRIALRRENMRAAYQDVWAKNGRKPNPVVEVPATPKPEPVEPPRRFPVQRFSMLGGRIV